MKKIAVMGATGSVGTQALDVAREYKGKIDIVCMSAHSSIEKLAAAANEFRPTALALTSEKADIKKMKSMLGYPAKIFIGNSAATDAMLYSGCDMAVLAVTGIAGLPEFADCLKNHIPVALANKEALVCGGRLIQKILKETGTPVLPVDSEHMAIYQCLGDSYNSSEVQNIWLTASGGPFLNLGKEEIDNAPPERALKHPNWSMGKKISIDSASLANKGLEVIEAHIMYGLPAEQIKVVIQPKSLIHSMVEFKDSTVLAQLGPVDMRLPLQKCMLYPEMRKYKFGCALNFWELGSLEFIKPDAERFPCLPLAYRAIENDTTAVYNIANETAVELYLSGKISFGSIADVISNSMETFGGRVFADIDDILALDIEVREYIANRYAKR